MSNPLSETDRAWLAGWLATVDANSDASQQLVARLVQQLLDAADLAPAGYDVPGPYDLALAFGQAFVASGKVDSIEAAMGQAWAAVPAFYAARDMYLRDIVPVIYGPGGPGAAGGNPAEGDGDGGRFQP